MHNFERKFNLPNQSVANIFEYLNIFVTNVYSDIHSYQFFRSEYIRTFVRVKFVCTNIFRHSFVNVLECKNKTNIRIFGAINESIICKKIRKRQKNSVCVLATNAPVDIFCSYLKDISIWHLAQWENHNQDFHQKIWKCQNICQCPTFHGITNSNFLSNIFKKKICCY